MIAADAMAGALAQYFDTAGRLPLAAQVRAADGAEVPLATAFTETLETIRAANARGNTLHFIGNGGSAAIASHMAVDFSKRADVRARAFNDGAMLTCLGNDLGYAEVFAHQLGLHLRPGDVLVAISSSGASRNILRGAEAARAVGTHVVSLSGFRADNPLRAAGDLNFYVGSDEYGFVELSHMALLSAMIDILIGWRPAGA